MSRKRHIDTRNLIVCNTFDEFTNKLEQINPNVEDIVGYITSLSQVIYGLTIESLWGTLGFTWDSTSILEGVPYNEERIEHIEADGENIDYSQKNAAWKIAHAVTKGYGHFNTTTIPFTLIPTIPDGYRMTEFRNTFNLIASDYIDVQKSDWSNLTEINYLIPAGKSINIDITDANLSSSSKVIIDNVGGGYNAGSWRHTVYVKGNLHNCTNGVFEYSGSAWDRNWDRHHTILLDDENKELDIPMSLATTNVFYYTDEEKTFDIADWIYKNTDSPVNLQYNLYAASGKYYIDNAFTNKIWNGTNSALRIFSYATSRVKPQDFTGVIKIVDPIAEEITPLDITVDCTEDDVVREDRLCGLTVGPGNFDHTNGIYNNIYTYDTQVFKPIKYIGTPTSITMWNPYVIVKDDNSWPTYSQPMVEKITTFYTTEKFDNNRVLDNTYGINQGYFMYGAFLYITKPFPYTIDCTNITNLNLFERAKFFISDYSSFETIEGLKVLELVKLVNPNSFISFSYASWTDCKTFYLKLKSLKTVFFNIPFFYSHYLFIPSREVIEASVFGNVNYGAVYSQYSNEVAFRIRHLDSRNYGGKYSAYFEVYGYDPKTIINNTYSYIDIEESAKADVTFLKASHIRTIRALNVQDKTYTIPIIGTNLPSGNNNISECLVIATTGNDYNNVYLEPSFVFIYKSSFELTGINRMSDISYYVNVFLNTIYPGLQENDSDDVYVILLSNNLYIELTTNYPTIVDRIENVLNYDIAASSK